MSIDFNLKVRGSGREVAVQGSWNLSVAVQGGRELSKLTVGRLSIDFSLKVRGSGPALVVQGRREAAGEEDADEVVESG